MNKKVAIIQARMGSQRYPGKVLAEINGKPAISYLLKSLERSDKINKIIVATSQEAQDKQITNYVRDLNIDCYAGSENNVLSRYVEVARMYRPNNIIRITGDDILLDYNIVDNIIARHISCKVDYTSNLFKRSFALGQEVEIFTFDTLMRINQYASTKNEHEHVTLYLRNNTKYFKTLNVIAPKKLKWPDLRIALDEKEDLDFIKILFKNLYNGKDPISYESIVNYLRENPELLKINSHIQRKPIEGIYY